MGRRWRKIRRSPHSDIRRRFNYNEVNATSVIESRSSVNMAFARYVDGSALIEIGDGVLSASVSPGRGGQLVSLKGQGGLELIYSNSVDGWQGGSPVLFPAVGRHRDGTYSLTRCSKGEDGVVQDQQLRMPLHGFVQDKQFDVTSFGIDDKGCPHVDLKLVHLGDVHYPFDFNLTIRYSIASYELVVRHDIKNLTTSGADKSFLMPFAIGNHITLRFPFTAGGRWDEGRVLTSLTHEHALAPGSLLSGKCIERSELGEAGSGLPLTNPLATDGVLGWGPAIVEGGDFTSKTCQLEVSQPGQVTVRLRHSYEGPGPRCARCGDAPGPSGPACPACGPRGRISADPHAHRHFVLWGEPPSADGSRGGFICPEPWLTGPDSLNTLAGTPLLKPGETATWAFHVYVMDHRHVL